MKGSRQIHRNNLVPLLRRHLQHGRSVLHASIVHQHVYLAVVRQDTFSQLSCGVAAAQIGAEKCRIAGAGGAHGGQGGGLPGVVGQAMQGDAPAVGRQTAGNGQTNATVGSGNECGYLSCHSALPATKPIA